LTAVSGKRRATRNGRARRKSPAAAYEKVNERDCTVRAANVYQGSKALDIGYYFRRKRGSEPVLLLTYKIPPGGSEGMHTHRPGDARVGSYDEFYYIISGTGRMWIGGEDVRIGTGDYIHVPNGVAHDVRNTSRRRALKLHLVAIQR
jgi:mannose-6-phosphate isomerase-like protein (cupin superfamily)